MQFLLCIMLICIIACNARELTTRDVNIRETRRSALDELRINTKITLDSLRLFNERLNKLQNIVEHNERMISDLVTLREHQKVLLENSNSIQLQLQQVKSELRIFSQQQGQQGRSLSMQEQTPNVWQQRVDTKLSKILNVAAEIYKEDKQLAAALASMRDSSQNGDTSFDQRIRKYVQEEFSVLRAEWKNEWNSLDTTCKRAKEQQENVTFMLLGWKDDLQNKQATDLSSALDASTSCNDAHSLNESLIVFKGDIEKMHLQLQQSITKENARLGEKLYTLANNYQQLSTLRNCDHNGRSKIEIKPLITEQPIVTAKSVTEKQESIEKNTIPKIAFRSSQSTFNEFSGPHIAAETLRSNSIEPKPDYRISPVRVSEMRLEKCKMRNNLMSPQSCYELFNSANAVCDGTYVILIHSRAIKTYCEMETGGWTVIMRRGKFHNQKIRENFKRKWVDYRDGFGDIENEFWIGLENLHQLTASGDQMLQVDLEAFDGDHISLVYNKIRIGNQSSQYKLEISEPVGHLSVANSLLYHHNAPFSTEDNMTNNNENCPLRCEGGWWFKGHKCHQALLTGAYNEDDEPLHKEGIQWPTWKHKKFLKSVQMKIRPKN